MRSSFVMMNRRLAQTTKCLEDAASDPDAVNRTKLLLAAIEVCADGCLANAHRGRDFLVFLALQYEANDFRLAWRESQVVDNASPLLRREDRRTT